MKVNWLGFGAFLLEVVAAGREWFAEANRDGEIDADEVSAFVDVIQEIAERHFQA
jgi:hypothetical protein